MKIVNFNLVIRNAWACLPLLVAGIAGGSGANASIIPTLQSVLACSPCAGGASAGFAYTYSVSLDSQQIINTGTNPAFGTIYDFGPILGGITDTGLLSTNFAFSIQLTNTPAALASVVDSALLANIRYTAVAPLVVASGTSLGTFTVISANAQGRQVNYDGQATKASDGITLTGNAGFIGAPSLSVVSQVPEPATAGLFLVGLAGALAIGRKRAFRS